MGRWPGLPHYWILGQYRGAPGFAHTYLRTSSLALASLFLLLSLPFYSYLNGRMSQFRVVDGTYIAKSFRKRYTCKFNVAASRSRRRKTRRFNRLNRTKFITDTLLYVQSCKLPPISPHKIELPQRSVRETRTKTNKETYKFERLKQNAKAKTTIL